MPSLEPDLVLMVVLMRFLFGNSLKKIRGFLKKIKTQFRLRLKLRIDIKL